MSPLLENVLIGLATGLVSGIVTGYYSGAIISRKVRFDTLQSEVFNHFNSINYMQQSNGVDVSAGSINQLTTIASDLFRFRHQAAGMAVLDAQKAVKDALQAAAQGTITSKQLEEEIDRARALVRSSKPTPRIYLPFGSM